MDTLSAVANASANRGQPHRVFDWLTAARLIHEHQPALASAGLGGDWEWTGGPIYAEAAPVPREKTYTYLASNWAIPELDLDGQVRACWVWQEGSGWDENTYWPPEALEVLRGEPS